MADLQEIPNWEPGIYQWEKTDVVEGGPTGKDNVPTRQLANRTLWLKNALRGFDNVTVVTSSATLSIADVLQKLVVIHANNASIACTLPTLTISDAGTVVAVMAYGVLKQISLISAGTNDIFLTDNGRQRIYLGDAESVKLVWLGDHWLIFEHTTNILEVGRFFYGYSNYINAVVAYGQLLKRADYPRLWEYVQSLSTSLISDFTWTSTPGNKGFFSTGDNATTFRVPDLRAMFIRGLDLGAGIDFGRLSDAPGGYEADEFKEHDHDYKKPLKDGSATGNAISHPDGPLVDSKTGKTGGYETRPKNIGLIPLIKI